MNDAERPVPPTKVAALFDALASDYDQSGTEFFTPVGERLAQLLQPATGERALDVGCGRGAVSLPLARAVAPGGSVLAVDAAPAMVQATAAQAAAAGIHNVSAQMADATVLDLGGGFDLVAASLVIFFFDQPDAVLSGWVDQLRPGGRIGITTFGELDATTRALDALFDPWLPKGLLDARTSGTAGPFASDDGVLGLMARAGAEDLVNVVEPSDLHFADVGAWQRFSMSTGQRMMWSHVPADERPALIQRAAALLADAGDDTGTTLRWNIRYSLGHRPN
jgi:ubiquinone/menaquinone biosynthesis C-methylase UbiE